MKYATLLLALISTAAFGAAQKITNSQVANNAAIAHSKMAAMTVGRAMVTDGSGFASASSVTGTELGYLSGVGSSIQTQLDGKQALDADLTALAALSGTNTLYYRSAANTWSPVTIGSNCTFTGGTFDCSGGGGGTWGSITGTLSDQTDLQAALDAKQAFDADLTALSALSGTNTIYYRSAANTWTAVTVGSGLSFSSGTLSASGGGGSGGAYGAQVGANSGGECAVTEAGGVDWVNGNATSLATGRCELTFTTPFANAPACVISPSSNATYSYGRVYGNPTTTSVVVQMNDSGASPANLPFNILCVGT